MKKILLIIFFVSLFSLTLISKNDSFAQNTNSTEIQNLQKDLDDFQDSINKKISEIDKKQKDILDKLDKNEIHLDTTAENIDKSLQNTSESFWFSAALSNVVAVSLALFGIMVSLMLTIGSITKKEGTSITNAAKWIIAGIAIGTLFYFLILNIQTIL